MATYVELHNPRSGEVKRLKVGWSWPLFLFSAFLGFPLFLRQLYHFAWLFFALWVLNLTIEYTARGEDGRIYQVLIYGLMVGLSFWIGAKGNELSGKNYLDRGWKFSDESTSPVLFARQAWGLILVDPSSRDAL